MKIKTRWQDRSFDVINITIMLLLCLITIYPFLYITSMSFGGSTTVSLSLIPKKLSMTAYERVLSNKNVISGFGNSVFRTVIGTFLTLIVTIGAAYALSKRDLPNRGFWTWIGVFTMFFSGGLIPSYLLIKNLGLLDSRIVLILPCLLSTYNMTIMRNFFMSLPISLEEAAKIDGANDVVILICIVIPISIPIIATVALWTAVGHWNAWFDSMIYIQTTGKQVMQVILRKIVMEGSTQLMMLETNALDYSMAKTEAVKAATIMVTTIPILIVYPFLQKYFVKGVLVGSLKG